MSKDLTLLLPSTAAAFAMLTDAPLPPTRLITGIPVYPDPCVITCMPDTLPLETNACAVAPDPLP